MSTCTQCGRSIRPIRPDSRYCMLPDCRKAYEREREKRRIRSGRVTAPVPQADRPDLPPLGVLLYDADGARVQCHVCGRWLGALSGHLRSHGMTASDYRQAYELPRGQSLAAPATQATLRAHALAHDLAATGRANLARAATPGRPKGTAARIGERIIRSKQAMVIGSPPSRAGPHGRPPYAVGNPE